MIELDIEMFKKSRPVKVSYRDQISFAVLLLVGVLSYLASTWLKCPYGKLDPCRKWFTDENGIAKLLTIGILSVIVYNYLLLQIFFQRRFKIFPYGLIFALSLVILWVSADGYDFIDHGGYNRLVLFGSVFAVIVGGVFLKTVDFIISSYHKYNQKRWFRLQKISIISIFILFIIQTMISRNQNAAEVYWDNPSFDVIGSNLSQSQCAFSQPKYHWWNIFAGLINFAKFTSCSGFDVSWLSLSGQNKTIYYAYPSITKVTHRNVESYATLADFALKVRQIDESETFKHESILTIPLKGNPKLEIKVVRDSKVAKSALQKIEKVFGSKIDGAPAENVLVLWMDTLSRQARDDHTS